MSSLAVAQGGQEPDTAFNKPMTTARDVTGLAMDAQGKFLAAVTLADPGTPLDALGKPDPHLYLYDAKGSNSFVYDAHHGQNYRDTVPSAQVVGVSASAADSSKAYIAVGGPAKTVALWNSVGETPDWETRVLYGDTVSAIAITSDGKRVFAGANTATNGTLSVYETQGTINKQAKYLWSYNVTKSFNDDPTRITDLALSRDGSRLVVGTTAGLLILDATRNTENDFAGETYKPEKCCGSTGAITTVDVSRDGQYVIAGTEDGFGYLVDRSGTEREIWSRSLEPTSSRVNDAAITLDGSHFAFATQSGEVIFLERVETAELAQLLYSPFSAGKPVKFLDYDATGTTLVAATDAQAFGFHKARPSALWTVNLANEGLDAPVTGLAVSDDGERFAVSGKTKVLPFKQSVKAAATVDRGVDDTVPVRPGDEVRFVFTVTNEGSKADEYELAIKKPFGWTVKGEHDARKAVFPGESRTFNVTFETPTGQTPGYQDATVNVVSLAKLAKTGTATEARVASFKLNISVTAVPDIRFETASDDLELEQGEPVDYVFTIRNVGNAEAQVNLTAIPDPSRVGSIWSLSFDEPQVIVGPGGTATARLEVTAPADAADGDYNDITIRGRVGQSTFAEVEVRARVSPTFGVSLESSDTAFDVPYGKTQAIKLRVQNTGNTRDLVNLSYSITPQTAAGAWTVNLDRDELDLNGRESRDITLAVKPKNREAPDLSIRVVARSEGGGMEEVLSLSVGIPTVDTQDEGNFLPAPGVALVTLAGIGAALVAARSRRPLR